MKFLNSMPLGLKLPTIMALLVATTVAVLTVVNVFLTEIVIKRSAAEKLENASRATAGRILTLLETIDRDLRLQADAPFTSQALIALSDGFESTESPSEKLRQVYITDNENPADSRDLLVSADTGSSYGFIHAIYHPTFDTRQNEMSYYDIFLFDTSGNLVYSVFKENDFATNMITGAWKDSGLAIAYRNAMALEATDPTVFVDFKPYEPSYFAPAAFASRPIFNEQGTLLGVLAIQMPMNSLNLAAQNLSGLGKTADGFVVGPDQLMRTDSRLTEENEILQKEVQGYVIGAGSGASGTLREGTGIHGEVVMSYVTPLNYRGLEWRIVVEEQINELLAGVNWALWRALLISLTIFAGALVVSIFFARTIGRPVQRLTETVTKVADGNLDQEVPEADRGDEIGALARATEVFRQNAIKMDILNKEQEAAREKMAQMNEEREIVAQREIEQARKQEEADRATAEAREQMMQKLGTSFGQVVNAAVAGNFGKRIEAEFDDETLVTLAQNINALMQAVDDGLSETGKLIERVANGDLTQRMQGSFDGAFADLQTNMNVMIDALRELAGNISESGITLEGSSDELRQTSDQLSRQAEQNAAAVEETSAALEELSASLKNVDRNVSQVSETAREARKTAETSEGIAAEAADSMTRIAHGSTEIARVTEVINDIAFQINLLALNAGVEAARAGEAGLGFSVVASEVRQLAQRASEAAKEISDVIKQSDLAVAEGVEKVASAKSSLEGIAQSVVQISDSVNEVTSAISEQAGGVAEISSSILQIDGNTQKQAASFEEVTASSRVLAEQARDLRQTTAQFQLPDGVVHTKGSVGSSAAA